MKRIRILLTTAGGGNANNLVRSLKKTGDDVYIVGTNISKFELAKSLTDKNYLIPKFNSDEYLSAMKEIISREEIDFCIPNHEFEIQRIVNSEESTLLSKCFLPSRDTVNLCVDKSKLIETLSVRRMNVPKSINLYSYNDIEKSFDELKVSADFPVWCRLRKGSASAGAAPVYSNEEAYFWIKYWEMHRGVSVSDFMMSEYLPGRDHHFFGLWKDGELITSKSIQRLEYVCSKYTISGTSSSPSLCKLVNDEAVLKVCLACVKAIDPKAQGLFGIDLKGNIDDEPCLTEINIGRFPRINYIFNLIDDNIARRYVDCGLKNDVQPVDHKSAPRPVYYLIRDFDSSPVLKSEDEINNSFVSLVSDNQ
jgi:carbamoyl-phosphate synthase large subunit